MSLRDLPHVLDIRTVGLAAAIDLAPRADAPGARVFEAMNLAFHDYGMVIRAAGDTIALTPPLIVSDGEIGEIVEKLGAVIRAVA